MAKKESNFTYTSLDNSAVIADLESKIAQWEREHYGNSLNLITAMATGDEAAAQAAVNNIANNEATILAAREQLAALQKAKPNDPVTPIPTPPDAPQPEDPNAPA